MFNETLALNSEERELFKCEVCDEHMKRRLSDMKDLFFRIFKNINKIIKYIRMKDEIIVKKTIDELGEIEREFINQFLLFKKLLKIKQHNDIEIKVEDKETKRDIIDDLERKRTLLIVNYYKYRNIIRM